MEHIKIENRFWDREMETLSRKEIEKIQLERLQAIVKYCYERVPFYTKRLDDAGVKPEDIRALEDIERIPPTTKADLTANYPYGLFAVPRKEVVRIHASSGTTGKPTVVGYTRKDLDTWSECVARVATMAGATDEDVAQISFGYGLFTGALGLHYGLEKIGASVVPISSGNTEKQVMVMKDFGTTALIATPSYGLYMTEVARDMGIKREDLKLRLGIFGSEGCTPEMRAQIEENIGIFVSDNYGMSELIGPGVSGECLYREGLHFAEDHFLPEIVDPDTLERKAHGEKGELIVTTLTKQASPLLRYRTKDITRLNYETCKCGRTHARMDKTTGRSDDMLKIKGVNVFPSQIESVIMGLDKISPHYQLIVRREGFSDTLEVVVELADASVLERYSELEALQKQVRSKLHVVLGLDTKVSLVEPRTIERFQGKAKRIVDLRKK